jgi:hypothetical protein
MNRRFGDRGMVTAEFAAALPVLVALLLACITGINAVAIRLRCIDLARDTALASARGQSLDLMNQQAHDLGAKIDIASQNRLIHVTVRVAVTPLGAAGPNISITAEAAAMAEPES